MRKVGVAMLATAGVLALALAGCKSSSGGVFSRARPNEFEVTRNAPLVVPPEFALVPPRPGQPRPQASDASTQALQSMFGGQAPRSTVESAVLTQAGADGIQPGARSAAGSPETNVVDKGTVTRDIIAAPEGQGEGAQVATPK